MKHNADIAAVLAESLELQGSLVALQRQIIAGVGRVNALVEMIKSLAPTCELRGKEMVSELKASNMMLNDRESLNFARLREDSSHTSLMSPDQSRPNLNAMPPVVGEFLKPVSRKQSIASVTSIESKRLSDGIRWNEADYANDEADCKIPISESDKETHQPFLPKPANQKPFTPRKWDENVLTVSSNEASINSIEKEKDELSLLQIRKKFVFKTARPNSVDASTMSSPLITSLEHKDPKMLRRGDFNKSDFSGKVKHTRKDILKQDVASSADFGGSGSPIRFSSLGEHRHSSNDQMIRKYLGRRNTGHLSVDFPVDSANTQEMSTNSIVQNRPSIVVTTEDLAESKEYSPEDTRPKFLWRKLRESLAQSQAIVDLVRHQELQREKSKSTKSEIVRDRSKRSTMSSKVTEKAAPETEKSEIAHALSFLEAWVTFPAFNEKGYYISRQSRKPDFKESTSLLRCGLHPLSIFGTIMSSCSICFLLTTIFQELYNAAYLPDIASCLNLSLGIDRIIERTGSIGTIISRILPVGGIFIVFMHIQACGLYYVSEMEGFLTWNQQFDHWAMFPGGGGIESAQLVDRYTWMLSQAVGNTFAMNFKPESVTEQITTIAFIVFGAILVAAIAYDSSGRLYRQKIDELKEYLNWKRIDDATKKKVLWYYEYKYRGKYFEEATLLADMNNSLRMVEIYPHETEINKQKQELATINCKRLIDQVPFLKREMKDGRDKIYLGKIATSLNVVYYISGDFVFHQGDIATEMYFIQTGKVNILVHAKWVATVNSGGFFGEVALIAHIPRTATIQAATDCTLYSLSSREFSHILNEFEDMKERIDSIYQDRMERVRREREEKLRIASQTPILITVSTFGNRLVGTKSHCWPDGSELEQGKIARCSRRTPSEQGPIEKDKDKTAALLSGRPKSALPVPASRLPVARADETHAHHSKMPSFGFSSSESSPVISRDATEIARLKEALRSSNSRYEQTLALLKKQVDTEEKDLNQCAKCIQTSMETIVLRTENERLQNELKELEGFKQTKRDFDKLKMDLETAHNDLVRASNKLHGREIEDQIKSDEIDELSASLTAAKRRIADLESNNYHSSQNTLMKDQEISDLTSRLATTLSELDALRDETARFKHMESEVDSLMQDRADLTSRLCESEREARELSVLNAEIKANAKKQLLQAEDYVNSQNLKISKLEETINLQQTTNHSLDIEVSRLTALVDSVATVSQRLQQSLALTSNMEDQIKKLQDSLKQSEFSRLALERVKDTIEFEKKEARSEAWAAEQQRDKLQEKLFIAEQELMQVKDESFKFQQRLESTLEILDDAKKESEITIEALRADLGKAESVAEDKTTKAEALSQRMEMLEFEVESIRKQKADLETSIDILALAKTQLEASVLELRSSITERDDKLVELRETLSTNHQQLADLTEEKSTLEIKIVELHSDVAKIRTELDGKQQELENLKSEHFHEVGSLAEAHSKALEVASAQRKELETAAETAHALAESAAKHLDSKTAEFAKVIQANEKCIRELTEEVDKCKQLADGRLANINDLNSLISSQANDIDILQSSKLENDSRTTLLELETEDLKKEISKLQTQIDTMEESEAAVKQKLKSAEEALNDKDAEIAKLEHLLDETRQKIASADESMASTEETIRHLQRKYEETCKVRLEIQEQLEGTLSEKEQLASKLQNAQLLDEQNTKELHAEIENLKLQLATERANSEVQAIKDEVIARSAQISQKDSTIVQLNSQLSCLREEVENLKSAIESSEKKIDALNEIVDAKSAEMDLMLQKLNSGADSMDSTSMRITKLQADIEELEDTKLSLLEILDAKDSQLANISKSLKEKDEKLQNTLQSVEALKKNQQELSDAYRGKDLTVKEFEISLLAIQETLDGRDEKILLLQSELEESQKNLKSMENIKQKKLLEMDEQCARAAEEIAALRDEITKLETIAKLHEEAVTELTECRNIVQNRDSRISELESALTIEKDRFESDVSQINKLVTERQELLETFKRRTAHLEDIEKERLREIDVLKSELNQLKQVLLAQADSVADAEASASANREENLSLKEEVTQMLKKNEAAETEILRLLKSETEIKDRMKSIEKKVSDLVESVCEAGSSSEGDYWELLESFVKDASERAKILEEAVKRLEKEKGEISDQKETDSVIQDLRTELAEKSQLAEEYEKRAQENEERNQILQDTSINLTRENKKLLAVKQKLEKSNEKLQKQLEAVQALAAISASANTTVNAVVAEPRITPTRTKRSAPSSASPSKIPRTEGKLKHGQQEPEIAPQRSRRMTLAAKRNDQMEAKPDSENCTQQ
ncbi:anaphase-promoting complex subunit Hcn1 [Entophlyctis luteolus]|nr:anaphase-promoting complex subunit Hcn1 [Entophlyctis luteolus]